jgi:Leucine-rich repeat (LRR) protein
MSRFLYTLCSFVLLAHVTQAASPTNELKSKLEKLGATVTVKDGVITQVSVKATDFKPEDFKLLNQCTGLKKLSISGKTVNDANLPLLAGLVELEELSTDQTALTDAGYKHFAQFPKLQRLSLFHPSWAMAEFTGSGLAHLKALPNLQRLTFAGSTADDRAMEAIGQLTQLRDFSTWHTAQTQAGSQHLKKLTNLTALRFGQRLPRGKDHAPSFDATTLALFAEIPSLEKLDVFEVKLTAADFTPLKKLTNLKMLNIHGTEITDADVAKVRELLPNVKVDFKPITEEERGNLSKKLRL